MKVESRIFEVLALFFFGAAIVYALLSREPAGVAGLALTAGLALIIGTYFRFVSRRLLQQRPEDDPDAEVSDGAGVVGFFSPGSYWPIGLAFAAAVTAIGVAYFLIWVMMTGVGLLLIMIAGLVFEYHLGPGHE